MPRRPNLGLLACIAGTVRLLSSYALHLRRVHPELREGVWRRHYLNNLPEVWRFSRPGWLVTHPQPRDSSGGLANIDVSEHDAAGVHVRTYRRSDTTTPALTLLWIHGGGYVSGVPEYDDIVCAFLARELNAVVVNPDYRLSSIAPYPAALDDCFTTLRWILGSPDYPALLVVSGQSAGAGIAASLVHKAHDTHTGPIAFQLLFEPMLDNATTRSPGRGVLCWGMITNILGWRAYLRDATEPLDYAVPARRADLRGLPPAFIAVGDLDLFYNEDAAYAHRLTQAGVPTRFYTMKGTYHGTLIRCLHTSAMQTMWAEALAAVRQAVG